jgi:pimeloyl-ACP methyl ester carboxylesterase
MVDAGRNGQAVRYFLTRVIGMPAPVVSVFKLFRRRWARTTATAPTLPHELQIMGNWRAPADELGALTMPTHVIVGDRSPSKLQAAHEAVLAANPGISAVRLPRQSHNVSMKALASAVIPLFASARSSEGRQP